MPTGTTPPPHGQSLDASMEQLQISKPLRSGAQAQQQQEALRKQQHEMLMMEAQQELLQEMLQMEIQLEMRERELQELDDPDHDDELTDQECIDKIVKTLSSNRL